MKEVGRMSIGEQIKRLRKQSGFKQNLVAEYLDVDQSLISKIENGEREVSTDMIKKLADLFGCQVNSFFEPDGKTEFLNTAFRKNDFSKKDLKSIAAINRIALNLDSMEKILKRYNEKN